MTDLLSYAEGGVGHCGLGGSPDAAEKLTPTVEARRKLVLDIVEAAGPTGISAERIAARLGLCAFNVTPRLSDLRKAGRVFDSQRRERNSGGVRCIVWVTADHSQPVKVGERA